MQEALQKFEATLRSGGYSLTAARKTVFLALIDKEPQTISELISSTKAKINRSSLYRTLELFESLGITSKTQIGWKYKIELSDDFTGHHHHLFCIKCGAVKSFEESATIANELTLIAANAGYQETGHQLEIRGICRHCSQY